MDTETIVVTIRDHDHDPLKVNVSAGRLTTHSSVFRRLINKLGLTKLEIEDFDPDIVLLFLTLLEDNKVDEIQDLQFRELHKLSVVFKVEWLINKCREWLVEKINCVESGMKYDDQLFLFKECRYVLEKWKVGNFMNLLISRLVLTDNNTVFISQYLRDFDTKQLELVMLKLAGSNTKIVLNIIIERISDQNSLDKNTKFLLQNINLAWCFEQNEELYLQLFEKISSMSDISNDDGNQMFRLMTESTREVSSRKKYTRSTDNTVVDSLTWKRLYNSCNKLDDINTRFIVAEHHGIINMSDVVHLLIYVTLSDNPPSTEESQKFINKLMKNFRDNPMNKVSSHYIDMWISVCRLSEREEIVQLIKTLKIIKDSICNLSSYHENVQLVGKLGADSFVVSSVKQLFGIKDRIKDGSKILFEFKHPCISHCELRGKCGFILQYFVQRPTGYKLELCREKADYTGTGIHYHDIVSVEDMDYYWILSGITPDGTRVTVPVRWWWRRNKMLPDNITWEGTQDCVDFNISKYLVAKH